jgi:hypothetical protein
MNTTENQGPVVSIGIDAAVMALHQVAIRGPGNAEDFRVRPTLAGLEELTVRLADWAPAMVVAEPTAGTWLPFRGKPCDTGTVPSWMPTGPTVALGRWQPGRCMMCGGPAEVTVSLKAGASGWSEFWIGRLDLDDLAWEVGQCLDDIAIADAEVATWRNKRGPLNCLTPVETWSAVGFPSGRAIWRGTLVDEPATTGAGSPGVW